MYGKMKQLKKFALLIFILLLTGCYDGPAASSTSGSVSFSASSSSLTLAPGEEGSVTLTNNGSAAATGLSISLGTSTDATLANTCGSSLAAGTSCQITITPGLTDITPHTTSILVAATGAGSLSIPVQVTPPTLAVSNTNISAPGSFTFYIANTSSRPAYLTGITIQQTSGSGISFNGSIPPACVQLIGGASCDVSVTVAADASGQASVDITGNFPEINDNLTVDPITVTAENTNGQALANVILNANASTVVRLHNSGAFPVVSPNLTLPNIPGITPSGTCASLAAGGNCDITLTAGGSPNGSDNLVFTGSNLQNTVSLAVTGNSNDVSFTPVARSSEDAVLRGLKYAEIEVDNESGSDVSLQSITSTLSNVAAASDTNHAPMIGCALSGTLTTGNKCKFWVVASNGSDVGTSAGTLSITYLVNGTNLETENLNTSVETDLYMAGGFSTATNQCYNGSTPGTCNNLAKWDGTQWNAVGGSFNLGDPNFSISDITTDPNGNIDLFLGEPITLGATSTQYLASWDGVVWNNFGGGVTADQTTLQSVQKMQFFAWDTETDPAHPVLYFYYVTPGNVWTLGSWTPTGNGGAGVLNDNVYQFSGVDSINSLVYASGKLYTTDSVAGNGAVSSANTSDLSSWTALSTAGFNAFAPVSLLINNNTIYDGGTFEVPASPDDLIYAATTYDLTGTGPFIPYYQIPLNPAPDDFFTGIYPQLVSANTFYFTADNYDGNARVLSAPTSNLNTFTEVGVSNTTGKSIVGTKALVLTQSSTLYAAGGFDGMNGTSANCIAKKSGGTWSTLDGATNNIATVCQGGQSPLGIILAPTLSIQ